MKYFSELYHRLHIYNHFSWTSKDWMALNKVTKMCMDFEEHIKKHSNKQPEKGFGGKIYHLLSLTVVSRRIDRNSNRSYNNVFRHETS
jgi:hypothetical protein